jgi:hypothetical protein
VRSGGECHQTRITFQITGEQTGALVFTGGGRGIFPPEVLAGDDQRGGAGGEFQIMPGIISGHGFAGGGRVTRRRERGLAER